MINYPCLKLNAVLANLCSLNISSNNTTMIHIYHKSIGEWFQSQANLTLYLIMNTITNSFESRKFDNVRICKLIWIEAIILMAQRKTAVTPLLTHWSYCSPALNHQYTIHPMKINTVYCAMVCCDTKSIANRLLWSILLNPSGLIHCNWDDCMISLVPE